MVNNKTTTMQLITTIIRSIRAFKICRRLLIWIHSAGHQQNRSPDPVCNPPGHTPKCQPWRPKNQHRVELNPVQCRGQFNWSGKCPRNNFPMMKIGCRVSRFNCRGLFALMCLTPAFFVSWKRLRLRTHNIFSSACNKVKEACGSSVQRTRQI